MAPPEWRKFAASRESTPPALARRVEIAAAVAGNLNVFSRVQRHGSFDGKDGFQKVASLKRQRSR